MLVIYEPKLRIEFDKIRFFLAGTGKNKSPEN